MRLLFLFFRRFDRLLLGSFVLLFAISLGLVLRRFYVHSTLFVPAPGGTYIEGSVGELHPLIPWFNVENDVNRDIASLVFAGLLKYNPETKSIEEDLAEMIVGGDGTVYTFKLKEGLQWHDSTPDAPHPVTADDVLYTFTTIQNPEFPNSLLRQNFQGVMVEKLDDRTVRFKLEEPYHFFPSNVTIGLLPKRSFEGVPIARLDQALDFGFAPVGCGPYGFKSLVQTELSTEVTLERFDRSIPPTYHLDRVVFRIFPDYATLLSDIRNLDGLRLVPRNAKGEPIVPRRFHAYHYSLPQYVAVFFNLDRPFLQDRELRLGVQLGTNKQAIVDVLHEKLIVDTPLLEIDTSDWRYQFDFDAAKGALFDSDWNLPEKTRLQRLLEKREANSVGPLRIDPIVLLDTGAFLTVTGSYTSLASGTTLNGISLVRSATSSGTWSAELPTDNQTGSILLGENIIRLLGPRGAILDTFYVWRTDDPKEYRRASEEQRLLEAFVSSRDGSVSPEERTSVQNFFLEGGMLRERRETDPTNVRVNHRGQSLELRLLTSPSPPEYRMIADVIASQWKELGVRVHTETPLTMEAFEEKLISRDYDLLLFGQSLLDNLDSYPYWHSSGAQRITGNKYDLRIDAYNLSQYSSLEADSLLEIIRTTRDERERQRSLAELREVLKRDVPAIFLYSPLYTFAYHEDVRGIALGALSLHSDRFLTLSTWYLKEQRQFRSGVSWLSFVPWIFHVGRSMSP